MADVYAVLGNYLEPTKTSRTGARAWYLPPNHDPGEGIRVLAVSRGGRMIDKWDRPRRLAGWRVKTIPDSHPFRRHPSWRCAVFYTDRAEAERMAASLQAQGDVARARKRRSEDTANAPLARNLAEAFRPAAIDPDQYIDFEPTGPDIDDPEPAPPWPPRFLLLRWPR